MSEGMQKLVKSQEKTLKSKDAADKGMDECLAIMIRLIEQSTTDGTTSDKLVESLEVMLRTLLETRKLLFALMQAA